MTADPMRIARWLLKREDGGSRSGHWVECPNCSYRPPLPTLDDGSSWQATGRFKNDMWMSVGYLLEVLAGDDHDCTRGRGSV